MKRGKTDLWGLTGRIFVLAILFAFLAPATAFAQHLRIFACAISNDSAGAFLGGSSRGSGLYQSDDTGKTWKHLGWDNIKCYSMDMVESSNGRILYMATGLGVLRSTDYGEHWKQITDWRVSEVMDVAVNQKQPSEIWLATAHGPWKSEDGCKTWTQVDKGLSTPYCSCIAIDTARSSRVFAGSSTDIYVNQGAYWRLISAHNGINALNQSGDEYWQAATDEGALFSKDSGNSFRLLDSGKGKGTVRRIPSWQYCSVSSAKARVDNAIFGSRSMTLLTGSGGVAYIAASDISEENFDDKLHDVSSSILIPRPGELHFSALLGTLDNGVYWAPRVVDGHALNNYLPKRQIGKLKSFLVTP